MARSSITKERELSDQALSEGKVQVREYGTIKIELYKEHEVYHVKMFREGRRLTWITFESLGKARRAFGSQCRSSKQLWKSGYANAKAN